MTIRHDLGDEKVSFNGFYLHYQTPQKLKTQTIV